MIQCALSHVRKKVLGLLKLAPKGSVLLAIRLLNFPKAWQLPSYSLGSPELSERVGISLNSLILI